MQDLANFQGTVNADSATDAAVRCPHARQSRAHWAQLQSLEHAKGGRPSRPPL